MFVGTLDVFHGIEEARNAGANLLDLHTTGPKTVIVSREQLQPPQKQGEPVTTPLDSIEGWTPEMISRMKEVWITTAEQVVALAATERGLRSLSEQLQVDIEQARQLYLAARDQLSPAARRELDQPADTSDFGRGALPPPLGNAEADT